MTVAISADEIAAINDFVKTLGCMTCANVTDSASVCRAAYVACGEQTNRYSLNLTARAMSGNIDGNVWDRMPNCIRLSLERNALTGTLPAALVGPSSQLLSMYVQSNRLSGTLPLLPASTVLEDFRVSSNQLEGTIPLAYFSLRNIVRLHVNDNKFSGDFPRPPMTTSQLLDNFFAGDNQFTGTIGTEWALLTRNRRIFFQGNSNRLTGTIPDLFATHQFAYFNFDNNALSGTVPSSLAGQTMMDRFNISHNALSGTFLAPGVRGFCVINGNQFSSCVEQPGARVLCCGASQPTATRTTGFVVTITRGGVPTGFGTTTTTSVTTTTATTASDTQDPLTLTTGVTSPMSGVDAALIGGVVGGIGFLLLVLIAAFVGMRAVQRRRQHAATPTQPTQYGALPARLYVDVDDVRRPEQRYDSPTSKLAQ